MDIMAGCERKGATDLEGDRTCANDLNTFYASFDCQNFEKKEKDRIGLLSENINKNGVESERIQLSGNEALQNYEDESRQNLKTRFYFT